MNWDNYQAWRGWAREEIRSRLAGLMPTGGRDVIIANGFVSLRPGALNQSGNARMAAVGEDGSETVLVVWGRLFLNINHEPPYDQYYLTRDWTDTLQLNSAGSLAVTSSFWNVQLYLFADGHQHTAIMELEARLHRLTTTNNRLVREQGTPAPRQELIVHEIDTSLGHAPLIVRIHQIILEPGEVTRREFTPLPVIATGLKPFTLKPAT